MSSFDCCKELKASYKKHIVRKTKYTTRISVLKILPNKCL